MKHTVVKIPVIESERGWGTKIDDYMVCLNVEDATKFRNEFNSKNESQNVPEWYMYADNDSIEMEINDDQFNFLQKNGRSWLSYLKILDKK